MSKTESSRYQEAMQEWYDEMALEEVCSSERDMAHQRYLDEQHELALKEDKGGTHPNT